MDKNGPEVVRVLVARGNDGQAHHYALTVDGLIVVDAVSVRGIETSTEHADTFVLVTDAGMIDITSEHLWMIVSGRVWTEPTLAYQKASQWVRHSQPSR